MSWRVLLVSELLPDPQPGGLALHVLDLARALHQRGCQVDLLGNDRHALSGCPGQQGPGRFFAELHGHQRLWKERSLGAFHPLRTRLTVRRLRERILAHAVNYDVVHYHGHLPWVAAALPPGLPFTQTRHDRSGDCMLRTRFRAGAEGPEGRCLSLDPADCARCARPAPGAAQAALSRWAVRDLRQRTAQALARHPAIFVSRQGLDLVSRLGGPAPHAAEVIHHGVPRAALAAAAAEPLRDGGPGPELFAAGALLPYKGFGALVEALGRTTLPVGWRLSVAGDGPERARLERLAAALPVRWLGWRPRDEVLRRTAGADAVVVPSVWDEPCAGTVLEALALGRVVHALRRGGTPELAALADGGVHRLRLADSTDELARALAGPPQGAVDPMAALQGFRGDVDHLADAVLAHYARHFQPRGRSA